LKKGTVLVADADEDEAPRVLLYLEHAIQDARTDRGGGRRVISKRLQFVEIDENDMAQVAGYAPYLDYRPLEDGEVELLGDVLAGSWLKGDLEAKGLNYGIQQAVPQHLEEVRTQTVARVEKTMTAVKDRLTKEINYWDHRANE